MIEDWSPFWTSMLHAIFMIGFASDKKLIHVSKKLLDLVALNDKLIVVW